MTHGLESISSAPPTLEAVIFDLDGVLADTASLHFRAWKSVFDEFLEARAASHGHAPMHFTEYEYARLVDGRSRQDGVRSFLASRSIDLADGDAADGPDANSIWGIGHRKDLRFKAMVNGGEVRPFNDALALVAQLEAVGILLAVASSSRNARQVLRVIEVDSRVAVVVDGEDCLRYGLRGKPAPDIFTRSIRELGVAPERTVVVEDSVAGVQAARAAGVGVVLGIARRSAVSATLDGAGADQVVRRLDVVTLKMLSRLLAQRSP